MKLRPYQQEVARAVLDSIQGGKGLTFAVEIARQGGKNELSAHLEVLLLTVCQPGLPHNFPSGGSIVKCSPTFKPQTIISMQRLKDRLDDFGFNGLYFAEMGYIIRLAGTRAVFLSADASASVVGHTADILLEIDESQDVSKEKYSKEFRPMGSSTNVTTIHYGTTWDDTTLLEDIKQTCIAQEKKDGTRRYFRYDWQEVARESADYRSYVESERDRLGEDHPLFRTQYALLPIAGGGGFLSRQQVILIQGTHHRQESPSKGSVYVAGIDLAGEKEQEKDFMLTAVKPRVDSTVITIAELDTTQRSHARAVEPTLRVVEQYQWTGTPHSQLHAQMVDLLKKWNCRVIAVDATGIGQPIASFLQEELGSRVQPFVFTQKSKSDMAFEVLAYVNGSRLKMYQQDGSPEYKETMFELDRARSQFRPNQTMNFYVDPSEGHDDFLMSLALTVEAARSYRPRYARGRLATG